MVDSDRGHVIRAGRRGKRIRALARDRQFIDLITKAKKFILIHVVLCIAPFVYLFFC